MKKMLLILGILCIIVFGFFYYKTLKNGNNISNKNEEEFIDYILNELSSYKANMKVTIYSNKTETEYELIQEVTKEKSVQEVLSPESIKGLKIETEGNILKIANTSLNLEKIYEEYEMILNNSLFLNVFIEDYKKNVSNIYEENNEIILETNIKNSNNTYAQYKELHINKETKAVKALIIKDNNKKIRVSIKYNDIEIK